MSQLVTPDPEDQALVRRRSLRRRLVPLTLLAAALLAMLGLRVGGQGDRMVAAKQGRVENRGGGDAKAWGSRRDEDQADAAEDPDAKEAPAPPAGPMPDAASWVGRRFAQTALPGEFPDGVEHLSQTLLVGPDWDPTTQPPTYLVERVRERGWDMLWLEHYLTPGSQDIEVSAAVVVSPRQAGEDVVEPGGCQLGGVSDGHVAALVRLHSDAPSTEVRQAWRLDPATGTIGSLPTAGWACSKVKD